MLKLTCSICLKNSIINRILNRVIPKRMVQPNIILVWSGGEQRSVSLIHIIYVSTHAHTHTSHTRRINWQENWVWLSPARVVQLDERFETTAVIISLHATIYMKSRRPAGGFQYDEKNTHSNPVLPLPKSSTDFLNRKSHLSEVGLQSLMSL